MYRFEFGMKFTVVLNKGNPVLKFGIHTVWYKICRFNCSKCLRCVMS